MTRAKVFRFVKIGAMALASLGTLSGCLVQNVKGNIPAQGPIITNTVIKLTETFALQLDKVVYWGAHAAVAYMITDPLAPNWDIEEAAFPDSYYHFSLKMKRYYTGGAGEAGALFHRRAKELMRQGGYDSYQVTEYSEGIESSVLGSQRVSNGVIRLVRGPLREDRGPRTEDLGLKVEDKGPKVTGIEEKAADKVQQAVEKGQRADGKRKRKEDRG